MMQLDDLLAKNSEWLKGEGPRSNIVISTRLRIARNIDGFSFPHWADNKVKEEIFEKIFSALRENIFLKESLFLRLKDVPAMDRDFLVERHLMSKEHAKDLEGKGLVVDSREIISIMVNEEDHLRSQVIMSGFNLAETWRMVDSLDTEIGKKLKYAYSSRFGYLTSCPTNTGTGLRASLMMHLPALEMTGQIENVYEAISKLGLTIRGFYGEGSEAEGNFYQISNQVSLGHSEIDILNGIEKVINKIIDREEETRRYLLDKKKRETTDGIFRSFGTLKNARIITSRELVKLLSSVRMGIDLKVIDGLRLQTVNEMLLFMQPAHLQKKHNVKLDSSERDIKRADLVREKLGEK
ncbi:MAG: protein arginine kinase [Candidatus Omnitrophica bacterium]|nr:protein arginine kinase [Candidatus Omnitrophota bacterium]